MRRSVSAISREEFQTINNLLTACQVCLRVKEAASKTYTDTRLVICCIHCMGKCRTVKLPVGLGSVFD